MDPALIAVLVKDILLPEVTAVIRAHSNATGTMPTDQQILDALQLDANTIIDRGQRYLAALTPAPAPPTAAA